MLSGAALGVPRAFSPETSRWSLLTARSPHTHAATRRVCVPDCLSLPNCKGTVPRSWRSGTCVVLRVLGQPGPRQARGRHFARVVRAAVGINWGRRRPACAGRPGGPLGVGSTGQAAVRTVRTGAPRRWRASGQRAGCGEGAPVCSGDTRSPGERWSRGTLTAPRAQGGLAWTRAVSASCTHTGLLSAALPRAPTRGELGVRDGGPRDSAAGPWAPSHDQKPARRGAINCK